LCSKEFCDAIENKALCDIESRGVHELKNISGEKEVFQILSDQASFLAIDPVCRMLILSEREAIPHPVHKEIFFCSDKCLNTYDSMKKDQHAKTS
jgi:YHS domain-containing protein